LEGIISSLYFYRMASNPVYLEDGEMKQPDFLVEVENG
jgi:hypothetical protein